MRCKTVFIDLGTISFSRRNPLPVDSKKIVVTENPNLLTMNFLKLYK
jgi:hypothetical protein